MEAGEGATARAVAATAQRHLGQPRKLALDCGRPQLCRQPRGVVAACACGPAAARMAACRLWRANDKRRWECLGRARQPGGSSCH